MDKIKTAILIINTSILVIFAIIAIIMTIYCWCTYADTPINEIPAWAYFFMIGNQNG